MNTITERKYRFVFDNGYTHDFWFSNLKIEWYQETLRLRKYDWEQASSTDIPFHIVLSQITAIIALEEKREVPADEGESQ